MLNEKKNEVVLRILIDLQKAFDTINHEVLLKKLQAIGFGPMYTMISVISL